MSGILSALGPSAAKAVVAALIAALTVVASQLEAGAAVDVWFVVKAFGAALVGHQSVYWKGNG